MYKAFSRNNKAGTIFKDSIYRSCDSIQLVEHVEFYYDYYMLRIVLSIEFIKPFLPKRKIRKLLVYHLVFWFFCPLIICIVSLNDAIWKKFKISCSCLIILTSFILISVLLFRVRREINRIAATGTQNRQRDEYDEAMKRKTFKITFHILITFVVSFFPFLIVVMVSKIWKEHDIFIQIYVRPWVFLFPSLTSLINPFIHTFRLKSIRDSLKGLF